jgi:hypothetical protein
MPTGSTMHTKLMQQSADISICQNVIAPTVAILLPWKRKVCPSCGSVMDRTAPKDAMVEEPVKQDNQKHKGGICRVKPSQSMKKEK